MYDKIHLEVVTPTTFSLHMDVDSCIAPGTDGYLGILPNHTFFITSLTEGRLIIKIGEDTNIFNIGKGYIEVSPEETHILTEHIESEKMTLDEIMKWGIQYREHE